MNSPVKVPPVVLPNQHRMFFVVIMMNGIQPVLASDFLWVGHSCSFCLKKLYDVERVLLYVLIDFFSATLFVKKQYKSLRPPAFCVIDDTLDM